MEQSSLAQGFFAPCAAEKCFESLEKIMEKYHFRQKIKEIS